MDLSPFLISLKTSLISTTITFFIGIYLARFVYSLRKFRGVIDACLTLPLVLPPSVLGFYLLLIFGKKGPIGSFFYQLFGYSIVFNFPANVISAVVVSYPLMYRTVLGAFDQVDKDLIDSARTLGIGKGKKFWKILIPLSRPGIMAGLILSLTRAMGEFGATMMIAGNIPGRTQSMSTAIYSAVQGGNKEEAFKWTLVITGFSLLLMVILSLWEKSQGKRRKNHGT